MKTAIIYLADGFEECEGLLAVDLLRRAGVRVITASVTGRREVVSSHQVPITADELAENADYAAADMIVLPGGMPGTTHLGESAVVLDQCRAFAHDKYVAAICAAPSVLAGLGLLEGKPVETAGNLITGKGLGAAIPFALELVRVLTDRETADRIAAAICYGG